MNPSASPAEDRLAGTKKGILESLMLSLSESLLFWLAIVLHSTGLASVLIARLTERSASRVVFQAFFLTCFFVVGAFTVLAIAYDSAYWISCGPTLSLMAVGATLDLRTQSATSF